MELSKQIKKQRMQLKLSQDELAEKIYVTRQTISNWENDKNYPDIHSLLLMSTLFQLSLDQLIKGDINIMKDTIKQEDIRTFQNQGIILTSLFIVCIVSIAPLVYFFDIYGSIIAAILFIITFLYSLKVEKSKKRNDVQTYKEIIAFMKGERLDEMKKHEEKGKRPYQSWFLAIVFGGVTFFIVYMLLQFFSYINL